MYSEMEKSIVNTSENLSGSNITGSTNVESKDCEEVSPEPTKLTKTCTRFYNCECSEEVCRVYGNIGK